MTKPLEYVLVLRKCYSDMTSRDGFKWPKFGHISCPDWKPTKECGNGLHGFLWGKANCPSDSITTRLKADKHGKWLVVKVFKKDIIQLSDKVKFPKGVVLFVGTRLEACTRIVNDPAYFKNGSQVQSVRSMYRQFSYC